MKDIKLDFWEKIKNDQKFKSSFYSLLREEKDSLGDVDEKLEQLLLSTARKYGIENATVDQLLKSCNYEISLEDLSKVSGGIDFSVKQKYWILILGIITSTCTITQLSPKGENSGSLNSELDVQHFAENSIEKLKDKIKNLISEKHDLEEENKKIKEENRVLKSMLKES